MSALQKANLIKISSNENALRTDEVFGVIQDIPQVGSRFVIFSEPLTPGASVRTVSTSPVQEVRELSIGTYEFKTLNTTYQVEIQALPPELCY